VSYGGLPNSDMDRSLDSVGNFTRIRHDAVRWYQVLDQRSVGDFAGKKMSIVRPASGTLLTVFFPFIV
jgi:hypothetical protein